MNLLIYSRYWSPSVGGVEIISKALADGLAKWSQLHPTNPVEVTLFTQTPAGKSDDSILPYRVIRKPSLREWIRKIRSADIVQLEGPSLFPLALGWLLRKPVVLQHHGYQSICPNGLLLYAPDRSLCPGHFMARRYQKCIQCNTPELGLFGSLRSLFLTFPRRWLARRATVNVGVSPHVTQRVSLPHTITIWNGVPATDLANGQDSAFDTHPLCFAYLGRLVAEKGLPVLLRASRDLASAGYDFRLKIVGDGPERPNLEKLADEYGLSTRTVFVGFVPASEIPQALQGVAAVVMPSVWEDVSPLTAMEQMMAGRLLIASDIGGLGLIANEGALKFPPGDSAALAIHMRWILDDPSRVLELKKKARLVALEKFTDQRMIAEHVELYQSLIHR
jgi:glycosyltransferase involved in cell wall biosynthesis